LVSGVNGVNGVNGPSCSNAAAFQGPGGLGGLDASVVPVFGRPGLDAWTTDAWGKGGKGGKGGKRCGESSGGWENHGKTMMKKIQMNQMESYTPISCGDRIDIDSN